MRLGGIKWSIIGSLIVRLEFGKNYLEFSAQDSSNSFYCCRNSFRFAGHVAIANQSMESLKMTIVRVSAPLRASTTHTEPKKRTDHSRIEWMDLVHKRSIFFHIHWNHCALQFGAFRWHLFKPVHFRPSYSDFVFNIFNNWSIITSSWRSIRTSCVVIEARGMY